MNLCPQTRSLTSSSVKVLKRLCFHFHAVQKQMFQTFKFFGKKKQTTTQQHQHKTNLYSSGLFACKLVKGTLTSFIMLYHRSCELIFMQVFLSYMQVWNVWIIRTQCSKMKNSQTHIHGGRKGRCEDAEDTTTTNSKCMKKV